MRQSRLGCGVAFLFVCLSASAQQSAENVKLLSDEQLEIPALSLITPDPFSFSGALAWVGAAPSEFRPVFNPAPLDTNTAGRTRLSDSSKQVVELPKKNLLDSVHGEVGVLYGHSLGKFDRDVEAGYIFGQVGDDKLQISVGGGYEHWSGRVPHFGR